MLTYHERNLYRRRIMHAEALMQWTGCSGNMVVSTLAIRMQRDARSGNLDVSIPGSRVCAHPSRTPSECTQSGNKS